MAARSRAKRDPAAEVPAVCTPALATLSTLPPANPEDWEFEIKFDGYRMLARIAEDVRLISRNGNDWTAKLLPLRDEIERMGLPPGWYDGEIVVHDSQGRPDFGLLQNSFDHKRTQNILYYLFDVPYFNGTDLRAAPLVERRAQLREALAKCDSEKVRFSEAFDAPPKEMVAAACQMGLEGIIGKRKSSPYASKRTPDWIKLKCGLRQEFVIGGYTDPSGARKGFGSLLLGTYDEKGRLIYAGSVGTGFDAKSLNAIYKQLLAIETDERPFAPHKELRKPGHWIHPNLVAEVAFAEWTHTGSIRHATFRGMRTDKAPGSIVREHAKEPPEEASGPFKAHHWGKSASAPKRPSQASRKGIKVTNGDRVVDPETGTTKLELVTYYASASSLMLPHLAGRPTSLVRAPAGIAGELFFQKHAETTTLAGVKRFPGDIHPGHPPMLDVATEEGLLSTAQWNVVEYHTQNAKGSDYGRPDRMIFDLDPGDGITWQQIQVAALLVRAMLEHLGLISFLKTSGGKGLHIDVPITPQYGWDLVKDVSKAIVTHMAKTLPDRFSAKSGPANRKQKIFIDYLRNGRGATTACAWSVRARPGLGVSVPVSWDELSSLTSGDHWRIANVAPRLEVGNAPWDGYPASAASIDETIEMVGLKRPKKT